MPRSSVALYFLGFPPHSSRDSAEAPIRRIVVDLPDLTKLGRTIPTMADFAQRSIREQLSDDDGIDASRCTFYASNFTAINKTTPVSVLDDGDKIIVAYLGEYPGKKGGGGDKDRKGEKSSSKGKKGYEDDFESDDYDPRGKRGGNSKDKKYDSDDSAPKKKSISKKIYDDSDDYDSKKKSSSKKPSTYDSDEYDSKKKVIKKPAYDSDEDDRRKSVVKKERPKSAGVRGLEKEKSKSMKDLDKGGDRPLWDKLKDKVRNTDVVDDFRRESMGVKKSSSSKGGRDDYEEFESRGKPSSSRDKDREYSTRSSDRDRGGRDRRRDSDEEYESKDRRRSEKDKNGDFPWDSPMTGSRSKPSLYVDTSRPKSSREESSGRGKETSSRSGAGLRAYTGRSRDNDYY